MNAVINQEKQTITFKVPETVKAPWKDSKDPEVPFTLEYSYKTLCGRVADIVKRYPSYSAYEFMGKDTTYTEMWAKVNECAKALKALGIREGDKVLICMPNTPQTLNMFYAVNMVGAVAVMVHPLSAESEIAFYLRDSQAVAAMTLDQFYPKFEKIMDMVDLKNLIVTSVKDELKPLLAAGYYVTEGHKYAIANPRRGVVMWKNFLKAGNGVQVYEAHRKPEDAAAILFSGGTTGVTKGILLSNLNFNAVAGQIVATNPMFRAGDSMLAVMPMFHGFGLGVSIHSMIANGGRCILIPRFTPKSYAEMLEKYHPNFIAGVPSLFEALLRNTTLDSVDLSCLKGVFSGGDSLSPELKKRFDAFLQNHGATITIREGYGATECVTASCLTPIHRQKESSIGIPFPDTYYTIVKPGTTEEVPCGEEGEICLTGPTVMMEYVNHPQETADTKQVHADGLTWVHTGDLGMMDEEGFVYFRQRIKRMIITNGYNVYPSQMEGVLDGCEYVQMSCVIGVPDPKKIQKVKAFVVLKPGFVPSDSIKEAIMEYCRKHIAKYALPYDIEFRDELPKTLVGKVAYRKLEEEDAEKRAHEAKIQQEIEKEEADKQEAEAQKLEDEARQQQELREQQKAEQEKKAAENREKSAALRDKVVSAVKNGAGKAVEMAKEKAKDLKEKLGKKAVQPTEDQNTDAPVTEAAGTVETEAAESKEEAKKSESAQEE